MKSFDIGAAAGQASSRARSLGQNERDFLPGALEIVETPASPAGRLIIFVILAFFCLALAWSWFGHVDIVASAQGRVVPTGRVKIVQSLNTGTISRILVNDGDRVRAGALLIRLDATIVRADRDRAAEDLLDAALDVARLSALARESDPRRVAMAFAPPVGASRADAERALALAIAQAAEQESKVDGLDREMDKARSEGRETQISIEKLGAAMPYVQAKRDLYASLLKLQFSNRVAYFESEQALIEAQHDLSTQREKAKEIVAEVAGLVTRRDETIAEYAHKILEDLDSAERKENEARQDLIKSQQKLDESDLSAPVDGIVQQLAVHTLGGVVTPAEPLLVIVPENQTLVVDARLKNSDVGFVHVGQPARIKVRTFNFTRYGLLQGRVVYLSPDAVSDDKGGQSKDQAAGDDAKADQNRTQDSSAYVARITLARQVMRIDGKEERLRPGMSVDVEIRTGSRRILAYLLSPLHKYAHEALRER